MKHQVTIALILKFGIFMLLLALLPMPYGFYQLLRIVVCGIAIYSVYSEEIIANKDLLKWSMIMVAALYNPVIPVHFSKEAWMVFNILTAGFFGYIAHIIRQHGNSK